MDYGSVKEKGSSDLRQNLVFEKCIDAFRRDRTKFVIDGYADALLAFSHTKGTGKLDHIAEAVRFDQMPELFDDLPRTLDMAGAADTYCDFHNNDLHSAAVPQAA